MFFASQRTDKPTGPHAAEIDAILADPMYSAEPMDVIREYSDRARDAIHGGPTLRLVRAAIREE